MNNNNSFKEIGEQIRDAVLDALNTGNFQDLGDKVQNTIDYTVKEVSKTVASNVSKTSTRTSYTAHTTGSTQHRTNTRKKPVIVDEPKRLPIVKIGQTSNIVYKVLGATFLGFFSILDLLFLLSAILDPGIIGGFFFTLALTAGSGLMLSRGISQGKRLRRAVKYAEITGNNHYINLSDLAIHTNQSEGKVRRDLRKMLKIGFYPQGHMDHQETCLMLNDKIYQEYLSIEKQRRTQELEEKRVQQAQKKNSKKQSSDTVLNDADTSSFDSAQSKTDTQSQELTAMINEGRDCISKLREMNDHIPGEEISAKLFRLESLLKGIFERLEEHPEQLPSMKKFMNYYLPTTLKLVAAYEEFDSSEVQSAEVNDAKEEIEHTLDTINSSFEELYARMFRDTVFDVTTDAKVLKTMLEQEGLGKSILQDHE